MKKSKRVTAAVLAALILCPRLSGEMLSYGAAPAPEVDETMYVNLDWYGKAEKVNVVKSCSLNGNTQYTDYGDYKEVINMSGDLKPVINGKQVQWTFPEAPRERFYYKGTMEPEQVRLPWDFEVSYKLNGVPAAAETLAGASGLVEIRIQATPNESALEYYRDNLVLMAAVPVDMSKCCSLEAPGAQLQNMGEISLAAFSALPGEEGDFTLRIGSDSFETTGVILAMAPGTIEDLEHIKDLKEAKDTWRDAGDDLYDSIEEMARSLEEMRAGVNQVQSGAQSAEQARKTWSGSKDQILASNDQTLAALQKMSDQMDAMVPHLETAKAAADDIHLHTNTIVSTLTDMQEPLRKLETRLHHIEVDSSALSEEAPEIRKLMVELTELDAGLQKAELDLLTSQAALAEELARIEEDYEMDDEDQDMEGPLTEEEIQEADRATQAQAALPDGRLRAGISRHEMPLLGTSQAETYGLFKEKVQVLQKISKASETLTTDLSNLLDAVSETSEFSQDLLENMDTLIEEVFNMNQIMDQYYPDVQAALSDSIDLVNSTTQALNSGIGTASALQNTLKASSDDFDAAARESLQGTMNLLDQSLSLLDGVSSARQAGRTMKNVLDDKLDEFETENRFLYMDPSAEKVSFTSSENPEPKTLQIVLRTEEISLDSEDNKVTDAEQEKAKISPLRRMWNVLVKMWQAIAAIFKER